MKVGGTIPDELAEWGNKQIDERVYFKWSHLIEVAITKLKDDQEGKIPLDKEG